MGFLWDVLGAKELQHGFWEVIFNPSEHTTSRQCAQRGSGWLICGELGRSEQNVRHRTKIVRLRMKECQA